MAWNCKESSDKKSSVKLNLSGLWKEVLWTGGSRGGVRGLRTLPSPPRSDLQVIYYLFETKNLALTGSYNILQLWNFAANLNSSIFHNVLFFGGYVPSQSSLFSTSWLCIRIYCIDTDEIPGICLNLKNHIFIVRSEDTIDIGVVMVT